MQGFHPPPAPAPVVFLMPDHEDGFFRAPTLRGEMIFLPQKMKEGGMYNTVYNSKRLGKIGLSARKDVVN